MLAFLCRTAGNNHHRRTSWMAKDANSGSICSLEDADQHLPVLSGDVVASGTSSFGLLAWRLQRAQ
jgi:hypothetical protein